MKRNDRPFRFLVALLTLALVLMPAARTRGDECPHQWTLVSTVPATCTESGYELYRCSLCGAEKRETLAALGHALSYCVPIQMATCTEEGIIRCYCARDASHYEDKTEPAKGHDWGEWRVIQRATLNDWGVSERTCSRCGAVDKSMRRPLAFREPYGLTLLLSPLGPTVRRADDGALTLIQEVSLVNTGETDLFVREYSCQPGAIRVLDEPLQLRRGQTATFPLTCAFTAAELPALTGPAAGPLTLCFYGSLEAGASVCASNQVSWTPALSSETGVEPLQLTQTLLSVSADPEGYQLTETLRGRVRVTNGGDEPLSHISLTSAAEPEPLLIEILAPGESRELDWAHAVTLEEAAAGFARVGWQVQGAPVASNDLVVPVISRLDLLLDVSPLSAPTDGARYQAGEEARFRLRLQNNGQLTLSDVTVFDPFSGDDAGKVLEQLDQLRPEEARELTLVHTFTPEEAEAGGLPVLITAQGYDPRGTLHTCTSGPILPPAGDW